MMNLAQMNEWRRQNGGGGATPFDGGQVDNGVGGQPFSELPSLSASPLTAQPFGGFGGFAPGAGHWGGMPRAHPFGTPPFYNMARPPAQVGLLGPQKAGGLLG